MSTPDQFRFSTTFQELMSYTPLTQEQIAELLGTSQPTVSRWISGQNAPHPLIRPLIYRTLLEAAV
jgi:predicted transcriptional regulator